jgi:hypothetical protein
LWFFEERDYRLVRFFGGETDIGENAYEIVRYWVEGLGIGGPQNL